MSVSLEKVYTIPELAKMTSCDVQKMRRRLHGINADMGGTLLRNTNPPGKRPHYTTTLSALRQAAPQWFRDGEAMENRLDDLEIRVETQTKLLDAAGNRIAALVQRQKQTEARADAFASSLRDVLARVDAA